MEGTNLHIVNGTIAGDVDFRQVGDDKQVANFSVACNRTYTKNGEKTNDVQYIRVECWGRLAETANKYLGKGKNVHVQGEVRTDKYTDKEGNTRYTTKTLAKIITFLPGGTRTENSTTSADEAKGQVEDLKNESTQNQNQNQTQNQAAPVSQKAFDGNDDDDDLPF